MNLMRGCYDLQTGLLTDSSCAAATFEDSAVQLCVLGKIYTEEAQQCNDGANIAGLYAAYGLQLTERLKGVYLLLIYDKSSRRLTVFQDRTTSSLTLYYTQTAQRLYYSTSLKALLSDSGIDRVFDDESAEEFVVNGYLYGRHTLVKNVEKIQSFHALTVQEGAVMQVPVRYTVAQMTAPQALERWEQTLTRAVCRAFDTEREINAPLSSGYDSSFIVHTAREQSALPINAFSIGGKFGKNELPRVQENVKCYEGLSLFTALTDEKTLQALPDIVWRTEGAVYETGLFLQYLLAKEVRANGKDYLICGECADQVMNMYYLEPDRISPSVSRADPMYFDFAQYPYIFGSYLILKKNGILCNSFDIETRYPYLDDDFVGVAAALRDINRTDKRCHVACCGRHLPRQVMENISKIGGATECHSLFAGQEEIRAFLGQVEQTAFYRAHEPMLLRRSFDADERQTGLTLAKTRIRNGVLGVLGVGKTGRAQAAYFRREMQLREHLCYLYIELFDRLILSGKYDDCFDRQGLDIGLKDIFP